MRRESDNWYNRIVRDSRYNDKKANRQIDPAVAYVNTPHLFELQNIQQNKCHYCWQTMSWMERSRNPCGLTLERLNNDLPHYKSNCVLACKRCNSRRYSPNRGLLVRYFQKWKALTFDPVVQVQSSRSPNYV